MKFPKAITIISFLTLSGLDPVYTRVVENSKRLIKTNADSPAEIIHTSELFDLIRRDITFVDITDFEYTTFPIQPARQTGICKGQVLIVFQMTQHLKFYYCSRVSHRPTVQCYSVEGHAEL